VRIRAAPTALERNGMTSLLVGSGEEARAAVRSILPIGAEVFNNTSRTLEAIGVADDIERSGQYQPLRPRLYQMDREMQAPEMRQLAAAPDFVVGSVHAVTEDGSLLSVGGPTGPPGVRRANGSTSSSSSTGSSRQADWPQSFCASRSGSEVQRLPTT
jgi:hypothetical protein